MISPMMSFIMRQIFLPMLTTTAPPWAAAQEPATERSRPAASLLLYAVEGPDTARGKELELADLPPLTRGGGGPRRQRRSPAQEEAPGSTAARPWGRSAVGCVNTVFWYVSIC